MSDPEAVMFGSVGEGAEDFRQAEWLANQPTVKGSWRYDHTAAIWHHWNGKRWAPDDTSQILRVTATAAAKAIINGRASGETKKLLNIAPQKRALEALATLDGYGTNGDDWDSDPYMLGVKNGIVDLRTNKLIDKPTSDILVTKTTKVEFHKCSDPSDFVKRAPRFMQAIGEWMSEDDEMIGFLLLWFGSSMFGFSPEQRFLIMSGIGRNGKGGLKHSVLSAIGEYGAQFDANLYMRTKFGAVRSDAARADLLALKGKRVTFFSEPEGNRFNEELLKAHTGGDQIVARALFSNNVQTWEPTHSITFLVNDTPEVEDVGTSMAARVMVADFRERFDGDKEDKTLYNTLEREKEGILAILVYAAGTWYRSWIEGGSGLRLPERVVEQSAAFMERNDPLAAFIEDSCNVGQGLSCASKVLYDDFREWFPESGLGGEMMSTVKFARLLERKGFHKARERDGIRWKNITLKSAVQRAVESGDD